MAEMSFQILFSVKAVNFIKYKMIPTGLCSPWEMCACPGLRTERGIEGFSGPFFFEDWLSLNCVNIKASGISPGGVQTGPPPGDMKQQRRQDAAGS